MLKNKGDLRKALVRISVRCVLPGRRQRVFCRPTDGHRLLNFMNRRFSILSGEVRKTGVSASRIDLSGYASFQHRRFLKAAAGQASIELMHHCMHLVSVWKTLGCSAACSSSLSLSTTGPDEAKNPCESSSGGTLSDDKGLIAVWRSIESLFALFLEIENLRQDEFWGWPPA